MTNITNGFTAHNIQFPDGMRTMPNRERLLADEPWCKSAQQTLRLIYSRGVRGKRIADLGCLEGGYALEFARVGMDAVGIEVRQSNYENCRAVSERTGLPNLRFVNDDAWNVDKHGPFDVIFCCGVLYHLDRPREFVRLMGKAARNTIIINTHYAPWDMTGSKFTLSDMTEHEGLPGRWYYEHDLVPGQELDALKWSSWENNQSFWLTKEALLHSIREAGFDIVFEQYDQVGNDVLSALRSPDFLGNHRGMFVGVKSEIRDIPKIANRFSLRVFR